MTIINYEQIRILTGIRQDVFNATSKSKVFFRKKYPARISKNQISPCLIKIVNIFLLLPIRKIYFFNILLFIHFIVLFLLKYFLFSFKYSPIFLLNDL